MRSLLIMLALASLCGCGLIRTNSSWVDDMPERHAASIAEIVAALAAERISPGSKPLRLAPTPVTRSTPDALTARLKSALEARGYRLAERTEGEAHNSLRYLITAYRGGYLLRVTVNGAETSTLLAAGPDGPLIANAPLSVREANP